MIQGQSFVYYGPEPWAGMWRNRHQLLSRLARQNRVLYVEPRPYLRDVVLGLGRGELSPGTLFKGGAAHWRDNLWVYRTPPYCAIGGGPLWRPIAAWLRAWHLRRTLAALGFDAPVVWFSRPDQADAWSDLPARLRVYHVVDEYFGYPGVRANERLRDWLAGRERQVMQWADLIIAVTPELVESRARSGTPARLLPNAADVDAFRSALAQPARLPDGLRPPVLGYVGLISVRLDLPAMIQVASRRPEWSWLLVGEAMDYWCETELAELRALPNVYLMASRPAGEIPAIVAAFDVGLIPYRVNLETQHASPLKLYEYLAAGLPVVSADVAAVRAFAPLVEIYHTADELEAAIDRALAGDSLQARQARWEAVAAHSWDARVETLSDILTEALERRASGQGDERHDHR